MDWTSPTQATNYQVNVRRNKTRKWVEAKVQSYDGDDWGADEFEGEGDDDDDDEEHTAAKSTPPPPQTQYPPPTQRAQLGSGLPSARSGSSTPSQKTGLSDLPSLRSHGRQTPVNQGTSPPSRTSTFERPSRSPPQPTPDNGAKLAEDDYTLEQSVSASSDAARGLANPVGTVDEMSAARNSLSDRDRRTSWERTGGSVESNHPSERVSQGAAAGVEAGSQWGQNAETPHEEPRRSPTTAPLVPEKVPLNDADEDESANAPGGAPLAFPVPDQDALHPTGGHPSILPLRTPSPLNPQKSTTLTEPIHHPITPSDVFRPLRRESTLDISETSPDTSGSSSVKESDVLSAEIMRSLNPTVTGLGGSSALGNVHTLALTPPADQDAARGNGCYHKTNWGNAAIGQAQMTEPETLRSAGPHTSLSSDASISPEQIWQSARDVQVPPSQAMSKSEGDSSSQVSKLRRRFSWEMQDEEDVQPTPPIRVDDHSSDVPGSVAADQEPAAAPRGMPHGVEIEAPSPSSTPQMQQSMLRPDDVSEQTISQGQETPSAFGAHSTVSALVASEGVSTANTEIGQEGKSLVDQTPAGPASTSPSDDTFARNASVTAAPPEGQPAASKIMSFKDILSLGSTMERILKFNESRRSLAAQEHGLDSWLSSLSTRHPELGFSSSATQLPPAAQGENAAISSQLTGQQPYYQQYLNASAPNTSSSSTSRSRLGGLPIPTQMSGSALSHSGAQIGTKSKEFMQSAGKMGKGLFSKGKSKFRGSGDKDESPSSPAPQSPSKGERRTTWRFSLAIAEPKSRNAALAPLDNEAREPAAASSLSTPAPQLPAQSPISPFNTESETGTAALWAVPHQAPASVYPRHVIEEATERTNGAELAKTTQLTSTTPPEARELRPESQLIPVRHQDVGGINGATLYDMVLSSRQSDDDQPSAGASLPASQEVTLVLAPEDSGVGLQFPPSKGFSDPGSPRIEIRSAKEGHAPLPLNGSADMSRRKAINTDKPLPPILVDPRASITESLVIDGPEENEHEASVVKIRLANPQLNQLVIETHDKANSYDRHRTDRQQIESRVLPYLKSLPSPTVKSFIATNPIKKLPPAGTWKLEESHLSEPLQPVTRKRSNTEFDQPVLFSSYNKEVELEPPVFPVSPVSPLTPAQPMPPRQRSDVPPSSAQRYPELFAPQSQSRPRSKSHLQIPVQPVQPLAGPDARVAGETRESSSPEERHRRRSSSLLKELGQRVTRATSKERRDSLSESRTSSSNVVGEDLVKTNTAAAESHEAKRRRPSFFGLAAGRASMDQSSSKLSRTTSHQPEQVIMGNREPIRPTTSGAQQLPVSGKMDRSFSAGLALNSSAASVDGKEQKRRVSGLASLFSRSKQGRNISNNGPTIVLNGSENGKHQSRPDADSANHKAQQNSAAGLISSALGRKLSSRSRSRTPLRQEQTQLPQEMYQLPQPQFGPPLLDLNDHLQNAYTESARRNSLENERNSIASAVTTSTFGGEVARPLRPRPPSSSYGLRDSANQTSPADSRDLPPSNLAAVQGQHRSEADQAEPMTPFDLALPHTQNLYFGGKLEGITHLDSPDDLAQAGQHWRSFSTNAAGISVPSTLKIEGQLPAQAQQPQPERSGRSKENRPKVSPDAAQTPEGSVGESSRTPSTQPLTPAKLPSERQKEESVPSDAKKQRAEAAEHSLRTVQSIVSDVSSVKRVLDPPSLVAGKLQGLPSITGYSLAQAQSVPNLTKKHRDAKQDGDPNNMAFVERRSNRSLVDVSGTKESATARPVQKTGTGRSDVPHTQPPAPPKQQEAAGFRWKGLRSRVAEKALASASQQQQGHDRPAKGEKAKSSNILGALRRTAKQSEPLNAQYAHDVWQQGPPFRPQSPQPKPAQTQQQQQAAQGQASIDYNRPLPPQPLSPPRQRLSNGAKGTPAKQQENVAGKRGAEPQYDPVPIPQGYSAVHGEGTSVPSSYRVRRPLPHDHAPSPEQHGPQPQQPQQKQQRTGSESLYQDTLRSRFNGQSSSSQHGRVSAQSDTSQGRQFRNSRNSSQYTNLHDTSLSSPGSVGKLDMAVESGASSTDAQSIPQSPEPSLQDSIEYGTQAQSSGSDVNKLRQQQPEGRMRSHVNGDEERETAKKSTKRGVKKARARSKEDLPPAELEDTEDARMRALRLAGQEEKIAIDPEDYEPKMSATSYPGQEWNPFGASDLGDLREE